MPHCGWASLAGQLTATSPVNGNAAFQASYRQGYKDAIICQRVLIAFLNMSDEKFPSKTIPVWHLVEVEQQICYFWQLWLPQRALAKTA